MFHVKHFGCAIAVYLWRTLQEFICSVQNNIISPHLVMDIP